MNTETLEAYDAPAEVLPVIIPVAELEKINATDVALAQLRHKAIELQTIGTPHKAAYEEIHALTMVAVKVRTGAMDIAKSLAAPHKDKYDAIMEEGKRIGQHAKESEALVRPLKEAYEAEQIRLKDEAAKAEAAKIATRIDNLYALGATFNGLTFDVFGVLIDAIEAKALPDEEWMELYGSAHKAYEVEIARLDVIQQQREAEAARLEEQRLQQQAEAKRLQAIADEQQRQQRELQARQDAFEKQQRDAEQEKLREKHAERHQRLIAAGFVEKGDGIMYHLHFRASGAMEPFSDADFDRFIESVNQATEQKKIDEIQAEQERIAAEAEQAKAQKQADDFLKKENKERAARLKADKKALRAWAIRLGNSPSTETTQDETRELLTGFLSRLSSLAQDFVIEIDNL